MCRLKGGRREIYYLTEHMPKSHQRYLEWTPSRLIRWAGTIGSHTQELVTFTLDNRPPPEQSYRSCLDVLCLRKWYSLERLGAACARILTFNADSYKNVESIRKSGLDQQPFETPSPQTRLSPLEHENLR